MDVKNLSFSININTLLTLLVLGGITAIFQEGKNQHDQTITLKANQETIAASLKDIPSIYATHMEVTEGDQINAKMVGNLERKVDNLRTNSSP